MHLTLEVHHTNLQAGVADGNSLLLIQQRQAPNGVR